MRFNLLLFSILWAISFEVFANNINLYKGSHIVFSYPHKFKVTHQTDEEGIKEIFIEGPHRTSVFITISPYPVEASLEEFNEFTHVYLSKQYFGFFDLSDRKTEYTSTIIDGIEVPGIIDTYNVNWFFKKRTLKYTLYKLIREENTYIISHESQGKHIKKHANDISSILGSIIIKK